MTYRSVFIQKGELSLPTPLTRMLRNEVPPWAVSRRVDCFEAVLEDHYNEMDEDEKADVLRDYFDDEYEG